MSSETQPISPARFAEALKDLPSSSLALKVLELRNAIAHLDYSNEELRPFAEGTIPTLEQQQQQQGSGEPDEDCRDAIRENEVVILRMQERIELIRVEVEGRGLSWREFQGNADEAGDAVQVVETETETRQVNGDTPTTTSTAVNGDGLSVAGQHEAWRDGTFQTGSLRGGEELLQQLLDRMPLEDDERDTDGGLHL